VFHGLGYFHGDNLANERKKAVRTAFRSAVFERDRYRCRSCTRPGQDRQGGSDHLKFHGETSVFKNLVKLDAHHICSRDLLPHGGYVEENGISVCDDCHLKAEAYWATGEVIEGFMPEDLYEMIGSSYEAAWQAAELKLGQET
jgi:hypothetical protein